MPDSGQPVFVKALDKHFQQADAFNQSPYTFVPVPSARDSRSGWIQEFQNRPKVLCAFFLPDISSPASLILSVKTLNWMKSQLSEGAAPHVVAIVKNAKEQGNLATFQQLLDSSVEVGTFRDGNPADLQKYVDIVANCPIPQA
jgi:uncharacterized protein (DUF2126 family)